MGTNPEYIIGVDEAGRGALAGPVHVGIVALPKDFDYSLLEGLKDAKQLSIKMRTNWYQRIRTWHRDGLLVARYRSSSHTYIDTHGINRAVQRAITSGLYEFDERHAHIKLDGLLHAPRIFKNQETYIKGDERELPIMLASVVAKVVRDARMVRLASQYPRYGFEKHKGYGTLSHRKTVGRYGRSPIHRKTFTSHL